MRHYRWCKTAGAALEVVDDVREQGSGRLAGFGAEKSGDKVKSALD